MRTLATGGDTGGSFELVEDVRNKDEGPAPHIHRQSDEAFYVLAGNFKFLRGVEHIDAGPGSFIWIPRGTPHQYQAMLDESRVLILYVPAGGFNDFLRTLDELLTAGMTSSEAMAALRGRFDSDPA